MTTFAIIAALPLFIYLLLVWTGVHNPYGIVELGQRLEGLIEDLKEIIDIHAEAEEITEEKHPNLTLFAQVIDAIIQGVLRGTFITFWICWFFGAFK